MAAHEGCAAHTDEFFPFLPHHVKYDPASNDPFTFRYYNKSEVIAGKTMSEWLRFSASGWAVKRLDGHDAGEIAAGLAWAMRSKKPTLLACKTIIGFGAPTKASPARGLACSAGLHESMGGGWRIAAHALSRRRAGRGLRRR